MLVLVRTLAAAAMAASLGLAAPSFAQTYPDRVIRLIAPNPAGGLGDLLLRTFGDYVTTPGPDSRR